MQFVFQDPFDSLNPRMTVGRLLSTPLIVHSPELSRAEQRARVEQALDLVGLFPAAADRYPHEFSGGQRQRIAIARALMPGPDLFGGGRTRSPRSTYRCRPRWSNLLLDLRDWSRPRRSCSSPTTLPWSARSPIASR